MSGLINDLFYRYFDNPVLKAKTDSALLELNSVNIAFTTDSFVVDPIFFPGGDIGKLAVCGTVNDLSVSGAKPLFLSTGFILEEGFLMEDLEKIVSSMADEVFKAGVMIVTGDTKVVDKGKCDKIFINTSGIGIIDTKYRDISYAKRIKPGDKIIINGNIGDHGTAILSARKGISYKTTVVSDCASLNKLIASCLEASGNIKFMRDATRGGVATILCELAEEKKIGIEIFENEIPVRNGVRGICEAFGFDPMYIANEGKVVMIVPAEDAGRILKIMKKDELGKESAVIGEITTDHKGKVVMNTGIGGRRIIDKLTGEQLPRIC